MVTRGHLVVVAFLAVVVLSGSGWSTAWAAAPSAPVRELTTGTPLVVDFTKKDERLDFTMTLDGKVEHHLEVTVAAGTVHLEALQRVTERGVPRQVLYRTDLSTNHGTFHERYDLPQDPGRYDCYALWRPLPTAKDVPGAKLEVKLVAGPALAAPETGAVGSLRVRGVPSGQVRVRAESGGRYDGREEGTGDRLPNGDVVLWLPAGMWTVRANAPDPKTAACQYGDCHYVPVFEGRETVLDWPGSLLTAQAAETGLGRLEILRADRGEADAAVLDVALLDREGSLALTKDAVSVVEGGLNGSVTAVEPLTTPLSVVLLLDSSGSMKGSMGAAVAATKKFVAGLPEDAKLTVVDFDTAPVVLPGSTRAGLLKALDAVVARGATCLFDSIMLGLERLKGEPATSRRALVVFTDGVDANWNDTAPGSKATKDQVLAAVKGSGIPVFSIGFGEKPDRDTLGRVSKLSGGSYFEAADAASLERVFAGITADMARQFRIHYDRPRAASAGDTPVVALMLDNSGSMDLAPTIKGCDYRIERVRQLFRRFVDALPDEVVVQVMSFSSLARVDQVFTTDKPRMRKALADMKGDGSTNIIDAVRTSARVLAAVPSTRRYLCFLSDAALAVEKQDQAELERLLGGLKDDGVQSLWVGMVAKADAAPFQKAASLAAGKAVVAEDLALIGPVVDTFLAGVRQAPTTDAGLSLRVTLRQGTKGVAAATRVPWTPLVAADTQVSVEAVRQTVGGEVRPYDGATAALVTGTSIPDRDVTVSSRLPVGETRSNRAASVTVDEAVFLDRLRGIDAPRKHRLLALTTVWRNVLPAQEVAVYPDGSTHPASFVAGAAPPLRVEHKVPTYLVPDLRRHCFLRWNTERLLPLSDATWLTEEPLTLPGDRALAVASSSPVTGTLVFLVPDEQMDQASLELFDTSYGHLQVPVAGDPPAAAVEAVTALPTRAPAKLSDAFSLELTGYRDRETIDGQAPGQGQVLRVVEGRMTSRVQALLNLAPAQRFSLLLPSSKGELVVPLHPLTAALPGGLFQSTTLAPGDRNEVAMAFQVPSALGRGTKLYVDVHGGAQVLPVDGGPEDPVVLGKPAFTGTYCSVTINRSGTLPFLNGVGRNFLAVDYTLSDTADGEHGRYGDLLALAPAPGTTKKLPDQATMRKGLANAADNRVTDPSKIGPSAATGRLLFGLDGSTVYLDGHTRRGLVLFDLPRDFAPSDLRIVSPLLGGDALPLGTDAYDDPTMLAVRLEGGDRSNPDSAFAARVATEAAALAALRRTQGRAKAGAAPATSLTLDSSSPERRPLAPPSPCVLGAERLAALVAQRGGDVTTAGVDVTGLRSALAGLKVLPSRRLRWHRAYGPEAVLTQGWGSVDDLAGLVRRVLTLRGYATVPGAVKTGGVSLPVVVVKEGTRTLTRLVVPSLDEIPATGVEELSESATESRVTLQLRLTVTERTGGSAAGSSRLAATALGGGSASRERSHTLLSASLRVDQLSEAPCTLFYTESPSLQGTQLAAILTGPGVTQVSADPLNLSQWTVLREDLLVGGENLPGSSWTRTFAEGESPVNSFRSFAVALPDLPPDALTRMGERWTTLREGADVPDSLSALQWFAGGTFARFIGAQTAFETEAVGRCGVELNRADAPRLMMLAGRKDSAEGPMTWSLDLTRVKAAVSGGTTEGQKAFSLMTGLAEGQLEELALPGGRGLFEVWRHCPEGTDLLALEGVGKREAIKQMRAMGWPAAVCDAIDRSGPFILMPDRPAWVDGKRRWAWLAVNPTTFETLTILDDGSHGSMAEDFIMNIMGNINQCMVGFLKGIESAIWARCAFSLELSDAKAVDVAAKKFCLGVAENFAVGASGKIAGEACGVGVAMGAMPSADVGLVGITFDGNWKPTINQNIVNFGTGYKAAVELYFRNR